MSIGPYQFRAPLWAILLVTTVILLTVVLGSWQVDRGHEKQRLIDAMEAAALAEPVRVDSNTTAQELRRLEGQRIRVSGRLMQRQLLHDNQVYERQPGFHVWSVLAFQGQAPAMIVNRGWVPAGSSRSRLPQTEVPEGGAEMTGVWRSLPQPGLRLGEQPCPARQWPAVVQYPRASDLECLIGRPVHDGLLLLDPDHADGFVRDWRDIGIQPERHFGYAFQWFALGAVLSVLFVVANLQRRETTEK